MELTTNRLFIRPLERSDWPSMGRIFRDFTQSPMAVYDYPMPVDAEQIQALTARFADNGLFFVVFPREEDQMLGYVCFHQVEETLDLGYCFHSSARGRGYGYESCRALMEAFRDQQGIRSFTAGTALENKPSCRLLARLGFACVSTERLSFHTDSRGEPVVFTGGNFAFRW